MKRGFFTIPLQINFKITKRILISKLKKICFTINYGVWLNLHLLTLKQFNGFLQEQIYVIQKYQFACSHPRGSVWRFSFCKINLTRRARQTCDGLLNKKKSGRLAPNAYITTPTFVNLQEKKWQILTRFCAGDDPGRTLELRVRNFLPDIFFLILKERKRITVTFLIIFLFFN
jgi:hypothetical protein